MNELFEKLLMLALKHNASDIHLQLQDDVLKISLRCANGIIDLKQSFDFSLFHYLKFMANLDLGNVGMPQSSNFTYRLKGNSYFFRFSFIQTIQVQSAVLRILNNHKKIVLSELSKDTKQNDIFKRWTRFRGGLTIISGPTGSGKTTTLNAILETIADNKRLKVISLEDPVEIHSDNYLQLQVNEKMNLDYEEGIKQLLRHDPDVIMIGEVRDQATAKTLIRCALSGHMIFTTIHAKSCVEVIYRLLDFGVKENELKQVLTSITNQRIFPNKTGKGRICIYEIMEKTNIEYYFKHKELPEDYKDIFKQIREAVDKKWIAKSYAAQDIEV